MSRLGGGSGSLSGRFQSALSLDDSNKPDSNKHPADLGSPISPLRTRPSATHTSSSSSSSGSLDKHHRAPSPSSSAAARQSGPTRRSHSGELTGSSDTSPVPHPRPGHRRSGSGPLVYSSIAYGSTATSPNANVLPTGNICPSGRVAKTGLTYRSQTRTDVLGSGTGNYGHGSIMRSGSAPGSASLSSSSMSSSAGGRRAPVTDPQELTKLGNEHYKKGQFAEALRCYDSAVEIWPGSAACRNNRAAALTGLRRLGEAVRECREAVRLDHTYGRAHHRLATLLLRLGQVENARKHLYLAGHQPDLLELQKIQSVERHLGRCAESRTIGDWKSALREADAAIAAGADSCPMLMASRVEALLRLHQLDEADSTLSDALKLEASSPSCSQAKFFGMISDSYMCVVRAKVDMALGRFESALAAAEKAREIDSGSAEVTTLLNNVRSAVRARAQGNEFFKSGDFAEASTAYGEGLKYDPANPVLHCNRAACRSKLGQWERSIDDCNEALRIQPSYKKALLRRAASFSKLERWAEAVRDYEVLRKELPGDSEVAESLFHAQVALKTSRGEEVSNMKFGGEVEKITCEEQFQAAISLPGVSVVHFMAASNQHCAQISPFVDSLCTRFPSLNFLKVDVNESPIIAKTENVRIVPTFKIYKNRTRVKEMICPSQQVLEYSVRHYGL
ncbi:TPR repeat-containing thioredoxin TTL1-like [Iris pallida]|uniref:TPR repeat-containing thioredoxin TTL1-like n=1 Tax=Iris pallida TaxID=29817 RepID=A0AAX6G2C5_IRIPA|nr:TPR repeat-containing thioredoxin TTL1-like [Iris pallida]